MRYSACKSVIPFIFEKPSSATKFCFFLATLSLAIFLKNVLSSYKKKEGEREKSYLGELKPHACNNKRLRTFIDVHPEQSRNFAQDFQQSNTLFRKS